MSTQVKQFFNTDINKAQIKTVETTPKTYTWDTSTKISVTPVTSEGKEVPLDVKGTRKATKKAKNSYLGNEIKFTDNSFCPHMFAVVQGGTVRETEAGVFEGYDAPVVGEEQDKQEFELITFGANYDERGNITDYLKITYRNCTGVIGGFEQEDDKFFAPEFTVISSPPNGVSPFSIDVATIAEYEAIV